MKARSDRFDFDCFRGRAAASAPLICYSKRHWQMILTREASPSAKDGIECSSWLPAFICCNRNTDYIIVCQERPTASPPYPIHPPASFPLKPNPTLQPSQLCPPLLYHYHSSPVQMRSCQGRDHKYCLHTRHSLAHAAASKRVKTPR